MKIKIKRWYEIIYSIVFSAFIFVPAALLVACNSSDERSTSAASPRLLATVTTNANPELTVSALEKVTEVRVARTVFDYTFRLVVTNNDNIAHSNVIARLKSAGLGTSIISGEVSLGAIPAGGSAKSVQTVTLRQDRSVPFNPSALIWDIKFDQLQSQTKVQVVKEAGEHIGLIVTKPTGESVQYGGDRDQNGVLVSLDTVIHHTSSGDTTLYITSPTRRDTTAPNGIRGSFELTGDGGLLVSFTDPSTGNTLKTKVTTAATTASSLNVSNVSNTAAKKQSVIARQRSSSGATASTTLMAQSFSLLPAPTAAAVVAASTTTVSHDNQFPVDIQTSQCGKFGPASGNVFVGLRGGSFSGSYRALPVSPGIYRAYIPNAAREVPVSVAALTDALRNARVLVNEICAQDPILLFTAGSRICTSVAAAVTASTLFAGTPAGVAILAACEASVSAAIAYCEFKAFFGPDTQGGAVKGIPDPLSDAIDQIQDSYIDKIPENFTGEATPYIDALPSPITGPTQKIPPNATTIKLVIDDFHVVVGELVITPPSPLAAQAYVASSKVQCLPAGSSSRISVLGSDGYTDVLTYPSAGSEQTISLSVPGGEAGVSDTIRLVVTPSVGGPPIQKVASLVFR